MQYHWCPFRKQGFELGCSSLIKHLPSRHKALSSIPNAGEREKERDRDGEREREMEPETHRGVHVRTEGLERCSTSQEMPRVARSHQKLREAWNRFFSST
jgi:hypothetical protein